MHIVLVCVLSLLFSFGAAIGVNVQKLSMTKEDELIKEGTKQEKKRSPLRQPLWCIGMLIIILDAIGDFVFIGLVPQSLLAPLGSLGLGFNIIIARIFHTGEIITRGIIGATIVIYIGTMITVSYAAGNTEESDVINLDTIRIFSKNPQFLIYILMCILFQCGMHIHGRRGGGYRLVHYCAISGCCGGYTMIFAKSLSEILKNALLHKSTGEILRSPTIPLLLVAGLIASIVTQMSVFNTGLSKFEASVVCPVYQSFINLFSITGGLVFFQEIRLMTSMDRIMYLFGLIIMLYGVSLLVNQRRRNLLLLPISNSKHSE